MKRKIEQYQNCDPAAMAKMSEAAILYALSDMREDLLELHSRLRGIEKAYAYCNALEMRDCMEVPIDQWESLAKAVA